MSHMSSSVIFCQRLNERTTLFYATPIFACRDQGREHIVHRMQVGQFLFDCHQLVHGQFTRLVTVGAVFELQQVRDLFKRESQLLSALDNPVLIFAS